MPLDLVCKEILLDTVCKEMLLDLICKEELQEKDEESQA